MKRRSVLRTLGAGTVAGLAGCIGGGRVVVEERTSVRVDPGRGWTRTITDISGTGAVSYAVRADRRFDVYYFTSQEAYSNYERHGGGETPSRMPGGHPDLGKIAVEMDDGGQYEAAMPADGGQKTVDASGTHHFVVDHSNYGQGIPVEDDADPLDAFVDLQVVDKQLPI